MGIVCCVWNMVGVGDVVVLGEGGGVGVGGLEWDGCGEVE